MEDSEGVLSFDFEGGLDTVPSAAAAPSGPLVQHDSSAAASAVSNGGPPAPVPSTADPAAVNVPGRRSFRQTVCRHWLRSLCMKGDACGFLHQYDKARMPVCRFFRLYGECREQDCVYKHTNEDIKECNMYKLGFCPNGPDCRYRHAKSPGPPPPVEEVLQKIQHLYSYNYNSSNKFFQQRGSSYAQQAEKSQLPQGTNSTNQVVTGKPLPAESGNAQPQQQVQQSQQQVSQSQMQNVANGQPNQASRSATPLPQGISRYFIVKSCNRENLELSVQQGVWATQRSNESKLNEAFDSVENVILIFSVNRTRHFQGCAKMTSRIGGSVAGGNWKYAHGTAHYGRNFSVKWLKLCELSFHKTRHLRNPYNENLPVKISRDCQELEPSIGEQLASLLYLEPDGELMAVSVAAESKREEEKAKGVNPDNGGENPDIVPFEDNEEEEEEESDEEEESFGHGVGPAGQGRGRGRGMMWPPHMPLGRGARPMPGMQGFNPVMMGDGLSYGPVAPDGFGMPDLFGVGPRAFAPYGPRFSGDFGGPPAAMMFRGRPSQPGMFPGGGFGMMMNPGRGPFMGGMGVAGANPARGGRPVNMPPMFPPPPPLPQNTNRLAKRDQRATDRNDRYGSGSEQGKSQDMLSQSGAPDDDTQYQQGYKANQDEHPAVNNFRNDDSESEDEAPRRSRHGEGKKKRRGPEAFVPFEWLHSELSNSCRSLLRVKQLHAFLLKTHLSEDPFYATKIVRQYAVHSDINSAHHVFDKTSNRSVYLWNSMIRAFAQSQRFFSAISLFRTMLGANTSPDGHTYACVIRACADNFDYGALRRVHGGSVAAGLGLDPVCCSALVTAYSKLGLVHEARRVFNRITEPDIVLWNSLISGYGSSGLWDVGMQMFSAMKLVGKKPDGYTLAGLLVGVVDSGVLSIGQGLHCLSQKSGLDSDSHVSSLLVSLYSRCKCIDYAYRVFCSILNPDLVTWSALIMGYSQAGVYEKVLYLFRKLNMEDRKADTVLVASVLASIARTTNVGLGCEVHGYALRHRLELDVRVSSALIDMYSKCGCLQLGISVFRIMPVRNVVSYNSVILGFGLHGYAYEAFKVFDEMLEKGLVPDEATFSSLLSTCCHAGLVKDGREIFRRMKEEFGIRARAEHYVYMVKLLGSSGKLEEAYSLIQSLPEPVDKAILGALLSCCNSCGNSKLAETVAQQLLANNPADNVYRVMLSNIYAGDGRWDDVRRLRDKISGGMRKMPGLSWIESN